MLVIEEGRMRFKGVEKDKLNLRLHIVGPRQAAMDLPQLYPYHVATADA